MIPQEERHGRIQSFWSDSVRFHGQECPLLALGVRVCDTALSRLELLEPAHDQLVCVCEYVGCTTDAIQIGLHCTSGKKHLLYYKTGRLTFTVYDLLRGRSVRICTKKEIEQSIRKLSWEEILTMDEEKLFRFEKAHPLTRKTLEKVSAACNAPQEGVPVRSAGVQDSPEQFRDYDAQDNGLGRAARRRN